MSPTSASASAQHARRFDPPAAATVPGAHLGLSWRPLGASDVAAVTALWARCDSHDEPVELFRSGTLERILSDAGPAGDSLGGFDAAGLRAAAVIVVEPFDAGTQVRLRATVDPDVRGHGIGKALLTWQEDRARQLLAEHVADGPARIMIEVDPHQHDRRRLYAAAGFAPVPGEDPGRTFVVAL